MGENYPLPLEGVCEESVLSLVSFAISNQKNINFFYGFWTSESASRAFSTIFWEAVIFGFIMVLFLVK